MIKFSRVKQFFHNIVQKIPGCRKRNMEKKSQFSCDDTISTLDIINADANNKSIITENVNYNKLVSMVLDIIFNVPVNIISTFCYFLIKNTKSRKKIAKICMVLVFYFALVTGGNMILDYQDNFMKNQSIHELGFNEKLERIRSFPVVVDLINVCLDGYSNPLKKKHTLDSIECFQNALKSFITSKNVHRNLENITLNVTIPPLNVTIPQINVTIQEVELLYLIQKNPYYFTLQELEIFILMTQNPYFVDIAITGYLIHEINLILTDRRQAYYDLVLNISGNASIASNYNSSLYDSLGNINYTVAQEQYNQITQYLYTYSNNQQIITSMNTTNQANKQIIKKNQQLAYQLYQGVINQSNYQSSGSATLGIIIGAEVPGVTLLPYRRNLDDNDSDMVDNIIYHDTSTVQE